ncbi:MAG: hypothetical protein H7Z43_05505, partial [Clostridia bacterium]|nr:hypothetical protein [Deltaproteobacteria bacterium]
MPRLTKKLREVWSTVLDDYVVSIAVAENGERIGAATANGTLAFASSGGGVTRRVDGAHVHGACAVAWSPDARVLASGGQDGLVRL